MRKITKRSDCPLSFSLDLLGDKWTLLILRDMALNGKHYYKDFLNAGEGIATNVLSDRLKMLESYSIITSQQDEVKKNMKKYRLADKGKQLIPVMIELWKWGAKNDPDSSVSPEEIKRREDNEEEIIQGYIRQADL